MIRPQFTRQRLDRTLLEIDDETLAERIASVRPLILKDDGHLYSFDLPDLRNTAYTWEPENLVELDSLNDWYVEVSRGFTQHSCAYHGFFKPSIAEVLAQMPNDAKITAFYLDTSTASVLDDGEGHLATVHWLTNKPVPVEERVARMKERYPDLKLD